MIISSSDRLTGGASCQSFTGQHKETQVKQYVHTCPHKHTQNENLLSQMNLTIIFLDSRRKLENLVRTQACIRTISNIPSRKWLYSY